MCQPTPHADRDSRDYFVYIARDSDGDVLYVSMTHNVSHRLLTHRSQSSWWYQFAQSWDVFGPYCKGVAHSVETWKIRQELPHFNGTDNPLMYAYNQRALARWRAGDRTPELTPTDRYLARLPRYADKELAPWGVRRTDPVYYAETGKARQVKTGTRRMD